MSTSPPPDDPLPADPALLPNPLPVAESLSPLSTVAEPAQASVVGQDIVGSLHDDRLPSQNRRRFWLPLCLFVATCATTFLAGCYHWYPAFLGEPLPDVINGSMVRDIHGEFVYLSLPEIIHKNWLDGLTFMACVISVLMMHEMGHFLMTIRHRIPASYPYFIPMPIMITGTMGAVISMDGSKANRKELFDIGLAGPLAGLVLTIPLVIIGIMKADIQPIQPGTHFGNPLLVQLLTPWLKPMPPHFQIQYNAIYMAGWVGMLITGLNMLPVSQLDGGHVAYAVLGPFARWLGRALLITAICFILWARAWNWILMLLIVILIGLDHPPTADDAVRIGPARWLLGLVSLMIPIFCFTPVPMS
ncbi:MAG: site-2 protease family protein [Planctomycetes bacterium]|nr:site-2 protease family protein [Planctomycetota bacterium]